MDDNLIGLQQSSKKIRNPFGFDFHCQWNSQAYVFRGTGKYAGKWQTLIGPLADHTAYHLHQLIRNKYHDEQTGKLREDGKLDAAKRYRMPAEVEDTIWQLITGVAEYPRKKSNKKEVEVANQNAKANLGSLSASLAAIKSDGRKARTGEVNQVADIAGLIDRAQKESMATRVGVGESDHVGGTAKITGEDVGSNGATDEVLDASEMGAHVADAGNEEDIDPNAEMTDVEEDATEEKVDPTADAETKEETTPAFGDLDSLDDDEEAKV